MTRLSSLIPDYETFILLGPDELGGLMLQVMNTNQKYQTTTIEHWANDLCGIHDGPYPRHRHDEVWRALAEAWAWLEAQVLIIPPDQSNGRNGYRIPSRRGRDLTDAEAFKGYRNASALPRIAIHNRLLTNVRPLFLRGDHDVAVFQAFKEVEVATREASKLDASLHGVDLMRKAFDPNHGPLTDMNALKGEREALAHLFSGAIGSYKNPHSHRTVNITDPQEAAELIIFASHLLRIIDARVGK